MFSYEVIHNGPSFTDDQLDRILNSGHFDYAIRGLATRNPYFARSFLTKNENPIPIIADICGLGYYAGQQFCDAVKAQGYPYLDAYRNENEKEYEALQASFYESYALEDEPLPMKYPEIIAVLEEANIKLSKEQKQSLKKLTGDVSDAECKQLVAKCKEVVKTRGWQARNNNLSEVED